MRRQQTTTSATRSGSSASVEAATCVWHGRSRSHLTQPSPQTARTIAALICQLGILSPLDLDSFPAILAFYNTRTGTSTEDIADAELAAMADPAVRAILAKQAASQRRSPVGVRFVGVFETVGSLGIPGHFVAPGELDYLGFSDNYCSTRVKTARHALALNENVRWPISLPDADV